LIKWLRKSTADYSDRELTVIAILTGSLMFMSDLLRRIPLPLKLDCLSVVSYHGKTQTSRDVIFKQLAVPDVAGRDVLILDDILDTGYTLAAVHKKLETANHAAFGSVCCCAKGNSARGTLMRTTVGFEIDDEFVVGYGLDFMERYRNLPYVRRAQKGIAGVTEPMNVRVQFYAQLRELIGAHQLELELPQGATVRELLEKIYVQRPALRAHDKSI
jgi:hypoxanthine phosphoribosyltransferase